MDRHTQLQQWLESLAADTYIDLNPASADASFRQYFRVTNKHDGKTYIVMDAPPDKEDCHPFALVTDLIRGVGANAPDILAIDIKQGFLLLDDLGSKPYLDHLDDDTAEELYTDAIKALIKMQSIDGLLPAYDENLLQTEMDLFEAWYLNRHLDIELNQEQKDCLAFIFQLLIKNAQEQPQVFVHRDYHSRNLMITEENNPGIIDYQDAVIGPITYDLVSLLKDCYVRWPTTRVRDWAMDFYALLPEQVRELVNEDEFLRLFDLMGAQRHLKAAGIFARLKHRDGKAGYIADIPRTLNYIVELAPRYEELGFVHRLIEEKVLTGLEAEA